MRDKTWGGGIENDVQKKRSPTEYFWGLGQANSLWVFFFAGQTFFFIAREKQSSEPGRVSRSAFRRHLWRCVDGNLYPLGDFSSRIMIAKYYYYYYVRMGRMLFVGRCLVLCRYSDNSRSNPCVLVAVNDSEKRHMILIALRFKYLHDPTGTCPTSNFVKALLEVWRTCISHSTDLQR